MGLNILFSYTACEGSIDPELSLSLSLSLHKKTIERRTGGPPARHSPPRLVLGRIKNKNFEEEFVGTVLFEYPVAVLAGHYIGFNVVVLQH